MQLLGEAVEEVPRLNQRYGAATSEKRVISLGASYTTAVMSARFQSTETMMGISTRESVVLWEYGVLFNLTISVIMTRVPGDVFRTFERQKRKNTLRNV